MAKKVAKKAGAQAPKLSIVDIKAKADAAVATRNNYEQALAWSKDPSKTSRERAEAAAAAKHYETQLEAVEEDVVDAIVEAGEKAEADAEAKAKAEAEAAAGN